MIETIQAYKASCPECVRIVRWTVVCETREAAERLLESHLISIHGQTKKGSNDNDRG